MRPRFDICRAEKDAMILCQNVPTYITGYMADGEKISFKNCLETNVKIGVFQEISSRLDRRSYFFSVAIVKYLLEKV